MAYETSPGTAGLPTDKVAVGYIVTQTLLDMKDALKTENAGSYVSLAMFLDNFIVQYKDQIYDRDMARSGLRGLSTMTVAQANDLLRITMKLLQRSNFMPVKAYDGQLIVDIQGEGTLKEDDNDDAGSDSL